jgi:hypothetical protein
VFPNPVSRGSVLFVAVEERHKAIEWTAEALTSEGAWLGAGLPNGGDGERIIEQTIRIPATFTDSIVVVRVVLPPHDTLYTTVRIR